MKTNKKWFTIVEIIIVVTIISIIWSIVLISTKWLEDNASKTAAKIKLWNISSAMNTYYLKFDQYPTNYYYEEN